VGGGNDFRVETIRNGEFKEESGRREICPPKGGETPQGGNLKKNKEEKRENMAKNRLVKNPWRAKTNFHRSRRGGIPRWDEKGIRKKSPSTWFPKKAGKKKGKQTAETSAGHSFPDTFSKAAYEINLIVGGGNTTMEKKRGKDTKRKKVFPAGVPRALKKK